jgi:hypothetical protein
MKRLILLAALLVAASACSSTPEATNANTATPMANTAANANTSATPITGAGATVKDSDITAKEEEIWGKIKAKDSEGFGGMLSDDFIYVAPEGIYDKAGTINGVKDFAPTELTFSDWKVLLLDKDAAVVAYKVIAKGTSGGKPIPETPLLCSSVWVNRGGKWVGVYHQETEPMSGPPPPPPAANKPATSASPTPEAKPAAAASSDVVADENMVWDALKRKDYDGFASLISDKAIEVEADGVHDKAGSVKGVSMFDFSKVTLSDFKTLKLTDNSSLVTYMVKSPSKGFNPLGERHSTVWSNTDGKWLAMFHQGTPVKPAPKSK